MKSWLVVQLNLGIVQMDVSIAQLATSIITLCIAVVGLIINRGEKNKFKLYVDPDQGYVSLGGSITTTLLVRGSYKNKVELSIPDKPTGVLVAFAPDKVLPKGRFNLFNKSAGTSTISINVSLNAEDRRYPIIIVGTEAVGSGSSNSGSRGRRQNSCTYQLYCGNVR